MLAGMRTKLQVTHFKLSHSRAFYLRAYLLQTHAKLVRQRIATCLGCTPNYTPSLRRMSAPYVLGKRRDIQ